jgi:hypothetical protein
LVQDGRTHSFSNPEEERIMMRKIFGVVAAAAAMTATPALAATSASPATEPVKMSDQELDQVTGGAGALLDLNVPIDILIKDVQVKIAIQNVPVNVGAAVQANALGTAAQTASVIAFQDVTQLAAQ